MLTSTPADGNRLSSLSSSTSSSSSSSPSPTLHTPPKTMEEVWKDLNLSALHHHQHSSSTNASQLHLNPPLPNTPHFIFQDFLGRPLNTDPPSNADINLNDTSASTLYPPPATLLSLNSAPRFDLLHSSHPLRHTSHFHPHDITNPSSSSFDAFPSSSAFASLPNNKRPQESDHPASNDRRHKRMIKNRESAARSRARKQAYTNELELEVAHLLEENARLKRQQEQYYLASAAHLPKRHTLQRTSTAPF